MSTETVETLLPERAELAAEVDKLQSATFLIDETLVVFGHRAGTNKSQPRLFAMGSLWPLSGKLSRKAASRVAEFIMRRKGFDLSDAFLKKRVAASVKDCRRRLNRGWASGGALKSRCTAPAER